MFRSRPLQGLLCFGLAIGCAALFVADVHAKRKGGRRRDKDGGVPPVEWAAGIAQAAEEARKDDGPYLIFFCSEDVAGFAGAGSRGVEKYSKTVTKMPPLTVFESAEVVDTLDAVEYPIAKIALTPQTVELARKYKVAAAPSLVACSPDGTVLCGLYGQVSEVNTIQLLKGLKETYAKWKKANPDKSLAAPVPAARPEAKKTASDDGP